MTAQDILFRASSVGHIMTEPKTVKAKEAGELAETVKTHLIDLFISANYQRREEITSKYLEKGNAREEDSITLYSRTQKTMFKKNGKRLKDSHLTGEPDLFIGESIEKATEIIDLKTSWSLFTFMRSKFADLNKLYYWQGMAYMALTGAQKHTVAYCLVNGTADAIMSEKRRLSYIPGMLSISGQESEEYKKRCAQIEMNHIFDMTAFEIENPGFEFHSAHGSALDIPFEERLHTFTIQRNEDEINALYSRIELCREWMDENLFNR